MDTTITTSVRNNSGAWEVIDREPGTSLDSVEVFAHDIGGEPGVPVLVELRDDEDNVIAAVETETR